MGFALSIWTLRATAFLTVFSLYAHTILGLPAAQVTPVIAGMIAACLLVAGALEAGRLRLDGHLDAGRMFSALTLSGAVLLMAISAMAGFVSRNPSTQEVGVAALQIGVPALIILSPNRLRLISLISLFCIGFAVLDACANLLAVVHIVDLQQYSGRMTDEGLLVRYPGLSGNTHAAGIVAMIAIIALCLRATKARPGAIVLYVSLMSLLISSLILIDARRYTVESLVASGWILAPRLRKIHPLVVILMLSGPALWGTFNNILDPTDDLRARLMQHGFYQSLQHPLLGRGVTYVPPTYDQPGYQTLAAEGVTESGFLDMAIAYGYPAALAFLFGSIAALSAIRRRISAPVVLVTLMTGELFYGTPLNGFIGSVLFYSSLIFIIQDEFKLDPIRSSIERSKEFGSSSLGSQEPRDQSILA